GNDVRDPDPPAGLEHARQLGEHSGLVDRQVDDAVGDDDVNGLGGQGNSFDDALEEDRVRDTCCGRVLAGQGKHLVGHVEPEGDAGGCDTLRGEDDVDAASRPEVEHDLALAEL